MDKPESTATWYRVMHKRYPAQTWHVWATSASHAIGIVLSHEPRLVEAQLIAEKVSS